MYTGIRALPNFPDQDYAEKTNVAILHYAPHILDLLHLSDPNKNIPVRKNLLKETDLHVGTLAICLFHECD